MIRSSITTLVLLAASGFVALPEANAATVTETRSVETETLSVTLTAQRDQQTGCLNDVQIRITQQGLVYANESIAQHLDQNQSICDVTEIDLKDLNGDGFLEVILQLYAGGIHCCNMSLIYGYNVSRQGRYTAVTQSWGNSSFRLADLNQDGSLEFVSWDDRFAFTFGSYALTHYPIQIWRYQVSGMRDVTTEYPETILDHARRLWNTFQTLHRGRQRARSDNARAQQAEAERAVLAAYLADKYLLGEANDGWARVRENYTWPDRDEFFTNLDQFFDETGYADLPQKSQTAASRSPL